MPSDILWMTTSVTSIPNTDKVFRNRSWVKGRLGRMFSISMAMDCASAPPMTMGNLRLPFTSPNTRA